MEEIDRAVAYIVAAGILEDDRIPSFSDSGNRAPGH